LLGALVAAGLFSDSSPAAAQSSGFALSRFDPSERGSEWFALDSLDLRGSGRLAVGVVVDGAYRPLSIYDANGDVQTEVVRHQVFAHPGASLVLWDRLRLGLSVPVVVYQDGDGGTLRGLSYAAPSTPAFGDIRLSGDVRILGEHRGPATLAAGLAVHLPTGSRDAFTSDGSVRLQPRVLLAGDIAAFSWAAKLGFTYRARDERVDDSPLGSELTFAAAAGLRLADGKVVVGPEIFGSSVVTDDAFLKTRSTPLDGILGFHWTFAEAWRFGAGGGAGLTQGFGSPEARYMVSLEHVTPVEERKVPVEPVSEPVRDRDRDGVPDDQDACPDTHGVATSDPKTNGCPPDRDGDGALDFDDACPDVPGVLSSDPKKNGCPPDRDGDGVLDAVDACPDTPGVATSDPKTNGCPPDPDRDKDSIPNEQDACPDEAGKPNPDPKKNGCPMAFVAQGQIKILEQVKFVTNSAAIQPGKDSQDVLNAVLKVLNEHPEIKRLRIEGHTDNAGAAVYNKKLSQSRADSVVAWLTSRGIAKDRLVGNGFGMERPIADNGTPDGRRENRRVEFHIEEDKAAPAP
jgi:outer membrane protein OmpA-like peptidoglycan-associated protein